MLHINELADHLLLQCYDGRDKTFSMNNIRLKEKRQRLVNVAKSMPPDELKHWSLDVVIDYIIDRHHRSSKQLSIVITDLTHQVVYKDGGKYPQTKELATEIFLFLHDYLNYMRREEQIVFANIKDVIRKRNSSEQSVATTLRLIKTLMEETLEEQRATSEKLKIFHALTDDYTVPGDACKDHKLLFEKMKEFESEFLLHAYLENTLLFPKLLMLLEEPETKFLSIAEQI